MKYKKHGTVYVIVFFLMGFLVSCAVVKPPEEKVTPYPTGKIVSGVPSDEDLFFLGTSYLGTAGGLTPDFFNARQAFEKLVKAYPESKWKNPAQNLISFIDKLQASPGKKSRMGANGPVDVEQLQQENEQLKKDLERLKSLEIELYKKEKMLR